MVDTFVPNDAFILGGSALGVGADVYVEEEDDDESREDRHCAKNSIIVCTGANACGKVGSARNLFPHPLTFDLPEYILKAGSSSPLLHLRRLH